MFPSDLLPVTEPVLMDSFQSIRRVSFSGNELRQWISLKINEMTLPPFPWGIGGFFLALDGTGMLAEKKVIEVCGFVKFTVMDIHGRKK